MMKKEYIEREAARAELIINDELYAADIVKSIPAADVMEVVHAYWIQIDQTKCKCSRCKVITLIAQYPHGDKNYCPNCGARMDGGVNDAADDADALIQWIEENECYTDRFKRIVAVLSKIALPWTLCLWCGVRIVSTDQPNRKNMMTDLTLRSQTRLARAIAMTIRFIRGIRATIGFVQEESEKEKDMKIIDLVNRLEALENRAGREAWGGEYREDMFDVLLHYFRLCKGRVSAGGLLAYMVDQSEKWFVEHGKRKGGDE